MGEHRLPRPRLQPDHEKHIRESRLRSARNYENPSTDCVAPGTRMWAARYIEDVTALLAELDHLRASTQGDRR